MRRRVVLGVAVALTLAAAGLWLLRWRSYAQPAVRRILLVSIDTCRADHLGCYGATSGATPTVDALAAESLLFENVFSPVPMTLPAHCAMLTGTSPLQHGVHDNFGYRLAETSVTLPELLHARGFATGAFVSSFVLAGKFGLNQGFDTYDDELPEKRTIFGNLNERHADATTDRACAWLETHRAEPFMLFVHYYDPHADYAPPEPFASRFADEPYTGEIAYVDAAVHRLIERLKALGLYDSTLIVVTSDHGEMLGEHGERTHSYFIYQSAIRVPLIIKLPGASSGRRVAQLCGTIDIAPTIGALAGVDIAAMEGADVSRFVAGAANDASDRAIYSESFTPLIYAANPLQGLLTPRWKYIAANRPELYDWVADPGETRNLAETEAEIAADLRARLAEVTARAASPARAADPAGGSAADRRRLEALGYVALAHAREPGGVDPQRTDPKDRIAFHENVKHLAVYIADRRFAEAEQLIGELLAIWPEFARGYVIRARIEMDRGDREAAERDLAAGLALDPDDADALTLLGDLRRGASPAEASALYREALARDETSAKAHIGLGIALVSTGNTREAIGHFRAALASDPGMAEAHVNLANALTREGAADEAGEHYEAALESAPRMVEAYLGLGAVRAAEGDFAAAEQALRRAGELAPDRADIHHNLATVLARQQKYSTAIEEYQAALRIRPDYPSAHQQLGAVLVLLRRSAEALPHFEAALRAEPDALAALNSAAWILATHPSAEVRRPADAVVFAERAARLSRRGSASVLDTLAAAHASAGNFAAAQATAREALALARGEGDAAQIVEIQSRLELYDRGEPFRAAPDASAPGGQ